MPSVPLTVTVVAFVAVTVKVDEPPEVIDAGLAVMLTVGVVLDATVIAAVADVLPPDPVAVAV